MFDLPEHNMVLVVFYGQKQPFVKISFFGITIAKCVLQIRFLKGLYQCQARFEIGAS